MSFFFFKFFLFFFRAFTELLFLDKEYQVPWTVILLSWCWVVIKLLYYIIFYIVFFIPLFLRNFFYFFLEPLVIELMFICCFVYIYYSTFEFIPLLFFYVFLCLLCSIYCIQFIGRDNICHIRKEKIVDNFSKCWKYWDWDTY